MESGFEGLDDALNIDYEAVDKELTEINDRSNQLEESKKEIAKHKQDDLDATIEDKEYLAMELKMIIQNSRNILEVLEQDIKIGTKPRYHEVYATLTKSVLDGLKELRELNNNVAQLKLQKEKLNIKRASANDKTSMQIGTQVNMQMTGGDFFKMVEDAKKQSSLNNIEPTFDLEGQPPKDLQ